MKGTSRSEDHVLGNSVVFPNINEQAIAPNINFTCDGRILSWTFGTQFRWNLSSYTELQIWRSIGGGSYTKVGSTSIMEEWSSPQIYQYNLTSPLSFQAGDILGYFQNSLSAYLRFENVTSGHPLYYVRQNSASTLFTIGSSSLFDGACMLVNVETGKCRLIKLSIIVNLFRMLQILQAVIVVS